MYIHSMLILLYGNQVLFKLVVNTVVVIDESADNCVKKGKLLAFLSFGF